MKRELHGVNIHEECKHYRRIVLRRVLWLIPVFDKVHFWCDLFKMKLRIDGKIETDVCCIIE